MFYSRLPCKYILHTYYNDMHPYERSFDYNKIYFITAVKPSYHVNRLKTIFEFPNNIINVSTLLGFQRETHLTAQRYYIFVGT